MEDCIFCKIVSKEVPSKIVYEDSDVLAFLDISQVSKGHTLVIPKKHYENVLDTPKDTLLKVISVAKDLGNKYKEILKADGINFMNASGKEAQQSVFHLHFHVVPRYKNDNLDLWFKGNPKAKEEIEETYKKILEGN